MNLIQNHISRRVDWRLRLAQEAATDGRTLSLSTHDEAVRRTAWFLGRASRLSDNQRRRLAQTVPELAWAITTFNEEGPVRGEVEARLLTDESPASIGAKVGASAGAITLYALLCFDVRWRLDQTGFIHEHVISAAAAAGRVRESLWKIVGYELGHQAIDVLLGRGRSTNASELLDRLAQVDQLAMRFRASQLASNLKVADTLSAPQLLAAVASLDKHKTETHAHSAILDNLDAMLKSMQFLVADVVNPPSECHDTCPAEWTDPEILRHRLGLMTPEAKDKLMNLGFPDWILEGENV